MTGSSPLAAGVAGVREEVADMAIPLGAGEAEGKAEAEGEDADAAVVRVAELLTPSCCAWRMPKTSLCGGL